MGDSSSGCVHQVEGAVTVQPYAGPMRGFEEYFLNLTPETNGRNPWFVEYWEDFFKCRYPNSAGNAAVETYTAISVNIRLFPISGNRLGQSRRHIPLYRRYL